MPIRKFISFLSVFSLAILIGCNKQDKAPTANVPSEAGKQYLLAAAPSGAVSVSEVHAGSADGDEVIAKGSIGSGDGHAFSEDGSSFLFTEGGGHGHDHHGHNHAEGEECPFCAGKEKTPAGMVIVQLKKTGSDDLVTEDLRPLLGIAEGQELVIQGTRSTNEVESVVILASKIYVNRDSHDHHDHGHAHGDHDHAHHDHGHDHDEHGHDHGDHKHGDHDHAHDKDHAEGDHKHQEGDDHDHEHKDEKKDEAAKAEGTPDEVKAE